MSQKLQDPPLRVYKFTSLLFIGLSLGAVQDLLIEEVTVWSRETQLAYVADVDICAPLPPATPTPTVDPRAAAINNFLTQKRSPLSGLGHIIVSAADRHGIDPFLTVAIAGKESSFGKRACGYNAWGFGSYHEGIEYFSRLLTQPLYYGKSLREIADTYCPPRSGCNTEKWIRDVTFFHSQLTKRDQQNL